MPLGIADIELGVVELVREGVDEALGGRAGRGTATEELGPHVVLDADDVETLGDEARDGLRADESAGSSDDGSGHGLVLGGDRDLLLTRDQVRFLAFVLGLALAAKQDAQARRSAS